MEKLKLNDPWYLKMVKRRTALRVVLINDLSILGYLLLARKVRIVELNRIISSLELELPEEELLGAESRSYWVSYLRFPRLADVPHFLKDWFAAH